MIVYPVVSDTPPDVGEHDSIETYNRNDFRG